MTPEHYQSFLHEIHILQAICGCGFAGVMFWTIVAFLKK